MRRGESDPSKTANLYQVLLFSWSRHWLLMPSRLYLLLFFLLWDLNRDGVLAATFIGPQVVLFDALPWRHWGLCCSACVEGKGHETSRPLFLCQCIPFKVVCDLRVHAGLDLMQQKWDHLHPREHDCFTARVPFNWHAGYNDFAKVKYFRRYFLSVYSSVMFCVSLRCTQQALCVGLLRYDAAVSCNKMGTGQATQFCQIEISTCSAFKVKWSFPSLHISCLSVTRVLFEDLQKM